MKLSNVEEIVREFGLDEELDYRIHRERMHAYATGQPAPSRQRLASDLLAEFTENARTLAEVLKESQIAEKAV